MSEGARPLVQALLVSLLIATYMFEVGLAAPPGSLRRVEPTAVVRGVILMLAISPLAALGLTKLFHSPPAVTVALILLAAVGVAPLAPRGARMVQGNAATGVVLTIVLALLAIFTAEPITRLLLSVSGKTLLRPGPVLLRVLLLQGAPLVLGILVRRTSRYAGALLSVLSKVTPVLFLVVVLIVLAPRLDALLAIGWSGAAVTFVFAFVLTGLGYLIGGPTIEDRRTITALTSMPNVGLALAIATSARLRQSMVVAIVGVFLLRILAGTLVRTAWAPRAARTAEHDRATGSVRAATRVLS